LFFWGQKELNTLRGRSREIKRGGEKDGVREEKIASRTKVRGTGKGKQVTNLVEGGRAKTTEDYKEGGPIVWHSQNQAEYMRTGGKAKRNPGGGNK